jgi:hypothetical protein
MSRGQSNGSPNKVLTMNELNAVSVDELNEIEGGTSALTSIVEKIIPPVKDILDLGPLIRTGPLL